MRPRLAGSFTSSRLNSLSSSIRNERSEVNRDGVPTRPLMSGTPRPESIRPFSMGSAGNVAGTRITWTLRPAWLASSQIVRPFLSFRTSGSSAGSAWCATKPAGIPTATAARTAIMPRVLKRARKNRRTPKVRINDRIPMASPAAIPFRFPNRNGRRVSVIMAKSGR